MACLLELRFNGEAHKRTCDQCSVSGYNGSCPRGYRFIRKAGISHNDYELVNKDNINNKGQLIGMDGIPCRLVLDPGVKIAGDKKMSVKLSTLENVKWLVDEMLDCQKKVEKIESLLKQNLHRAKSVERGIKEAFLRQAYKVLDLMPGSKVSVAELYAVLPLRRDYLMAHIFDVKSLLEPYGMVIDMDGALKTTLKDATDDEYAADESVGDE